MKSSICIRIIIGSVALFSSHFSFATVYYVSPGGKDTLGGGGFTNPWRTLQYAVSQVPASQGHTIQLTEGIFVENGPLELPPGVSIEGAGKDVTIIKADSSFYYHPKDPGYSLDKYLIRLNSSTWHLHPPPG